MEETILDLLLMLTLPFNMYTLFGVLITLAINLFDVYNFLIQHPLEWKITSLPPSTIWITLKILYFNPSTSNTSTTCLLITNNGLTFAYHLSKCIVPKNDMAIYGLPQGEETSLVLWHLKWKNDIYVPSFIMIKHA